MKTAFLVPLFRGGLSFEGFGGIGWPPSRSMAYSNFAYKRKTTDSRVSISWPRSMYLIPSTRSVRPHDSSNTAPAVGLEGHDGGALLLAQGPRHLLRLIDLIN